MIDSVSRCKLPLALKNSIAKAVENHCLNCGLRLDLDVTAVSILPSNLLATFTTLLTHASNVDSRSKKLVLEVLKIFTEHFDDVDVGSPPHLSAKDIASDVNNGTRASPLVPNVSGTLLQHFFGYETTDLLFYLNLHLLFCVQSVFSALFGIIRSRHSHYLSY